MNYRIGQRGVDINDVNIMAGMVNLAEPPIEKRLGYCNCPEATDFDINSMRGDTPPADGVPKINEGIEACEENKVLAGQKKSDIPAFVGFSGMEWLVEKRKECPAKRMSEEELDELSVLSGMRQRTAEELFIDELEQKVKLLTSEIESIVNILKTLIRDKK